MNGNRDSAETPLVLGPMSHTAAPADCVGVVHTARSPRAVRASLWVFVLLVAEFQRQQGGLLGPLLAVEAVAGARADVGGDVTLALNAACSKDGYTHCAAFYAALLAYRDGTVLPRSRLNSSTGPMMAQPMNVGYTLTDNAGNAGKGVQNSAYNWMERSPPVNAQIGLAWSSVTIPSAQLAHVTQDVMMGYGATSAQLSNKQEFQYFMRVCPPDSIQSRVLVQMVLRLGATTMLWIYVDESYSRGIFESFRDNAGSRIAIRATPLVHQPDQILADPTLWTPDIARLVARPERVLGVVGNDLVPLVEALVRTHMLRPDIQLLSPESFAGSILLYPALKQVAGLQGILIVTPVTKSLEWPSFVTHWKTLSASVFPSFFKNDTQGPVDAVRPLTSAAFDDAPVDFYDPFLVDSTFAVLFAMERVHVKTGTAFGNIRGKILLDELAKTSFMGVSGTVAFDANGDRTGDYIVVNVRTVGGAVETVGSWSPITGLLYGAEAGARFLEPVYAGNRSTPAPPLATGCGAGSERAVGQWQCSLCSAGTYRSNATELPVNSQSPSPSDGSPINQPASCRACPGGFVAPEPGATLCSACRAGTYQPSPGETACTLCPSGKASLVPASTNCAACVPGTFAQWGSPECKLCGRRTFQASYGATHCQGCPNSLTTLVAGAAKLDECVCGSNEIWSRSAITGRDASASFGELQHYNGEVAPTVDATHASGFRCLGCNMEPSLEGTVCRGGHGCRPIRNVSITTSFPCPAESRCIASSAMCAKACVVSIWQAAAVCSEYSSTLTGCIGWSSPSPRNIDWSHDTARLPAHLQTPHVGPQLLAEDLASLRAIDVTGLWENDPVLAAMGMGTWAVLGSAVPAGDAAGRRSTRTMPGWELELHRRHCPAELVVRAPLLVEPGYYAPADGRLNGRLVQHYPEGPTTNFDGSGFELIVFQCSSRSACPGGKIGTCFQGQSGLSCGACEIGFYRTGAGRCVVCDERRETFSFLFMCLGALLAVPLHYYLTSGRGRTSARDMRGVMQSGPCILSILATTLQSVALFTDLDLPWPGEGWTALNGAARILIFDVGFIHMSCFSNADIVLEYVLLCMVPLGIVAVYVLVKVLFSRCIDMPWARVVNNASSVLVVMLTAVGLVAVMPFQCSSHPNDLVSTLAQHPHLLCSREPHGTIMAVGMSVLIFFLVPFLSMLAWAVLRLPQLCLTRPHLLEAFRFLIKRFQPQHYYFGLVVVTRKLFTAGVSAFDANHPGERIAAMCVITGIYSVLQLSLWPWGTRESNQVDAVCSLFVMITCVIAASQLTVTDESLKSISLASDVVIIISGAIVTALVGSVCWETVRSTSDEMREEARARKGALVTRLDRLGKTMASATHVISGAGTDEYLHSFNSQEWDTLMEACAVLEGELCELAGDQSAGAKHSVHAGSVSSSSVNGNRTNFDGGPVPDGSHLALSGQVPAGAAMGESFSPCAGGVSGVSAASAGGGAKPSQSWMSLGADTSFTLSTASRVRVRDQRYARRLARAAALPRWQVFQQWTMGSSHRAPRGGAAGGVGVVPSEVVVTSRRRSSPEAGTEGAGVDMQHDDRPHVGDEAANAGPPIAGAGVAMDDIDMPGTVEADVHAEDVQ